MTAPLVSVVIVSCNSQKDLVACLPTLLSQPVSMEIIVVDNCSEDGTPEWLEQAYPSVNTIRSRRNQGYASANNVGVEVARGTYIFILNPDTELFPGALLELLTVVKEHPGTIVTPKLLQQDGTINACGNEMHMTGITTCYGVGESPDAYTGVFPVFLISGAAFLLTRTVWDDIGGFVEDYFLYMEDVDFSLRARLLGYEIACCGQSNIVHKWSLRLGPQKYFYLERNRLLTLLKVYKKKTLIRLGFSFLFTELATWAYALLKGPAYLKARVGTYISIWRMRDGLRTSRALIQSRRTVSDAQLLAHMSSVLPFSQLAPPRIAKLLTRTTTPIYKAFAVRGNRM